PDGVYHGIRASIDIFFVSIAQAPKFVNVFCHKPKKPPVRDPSLTLKDDATGGFLVVSLEL
ncbi:MAG: hypothetical protein IIX69_03370, partial [Clostridia bacterium]|nr:hypothetical protein [Clostridia bacterium]